MLQPIFLGILVRVVFLAPFWAREGRGGDLGTVAHEHGSFFFPDNVHGAANAAGFGWRNGG